MKNNEQKMVGINVEHQFNVNNDAELEEIYYKLWEDDRL